MREYFISEKAGIYTGASCVFQSFLMYAVTWSCNPRGRRGAMPGENPVTFPV